MRKKLKGYEIIGLFVFLPILAYITSIDLSVKYRLIIVVTYTITTYIIVLIVPRSTRYCDTNKEPLILANTPEDAFKMYINKAHKSNSLGVGDFDLLSSKMKEAIMLGADLFRQRKYKVTDKFTNGKFTYLKVYTTHLDYSILKKELDLLLSEYNSMLNNNQVNIESLYDSVLDEFISLVDNLEHTISKTYTIKTKKRRSSSKYIVHVDDNLLSFADGGYLDILFNFENKVNDVIKVYTS